MTTILIKKKDTAGAPAPGDLTNAAGGAEFGLVGRLGAKIALGASCRAEAAWLARGAARCP